MHVHGGQGSVVDILHQRRDHALQEGSVALEVLRVPHAAQHPEESRHGEGLDLKALILRECGQCHLQQTASRPQGEVCELQRLPFWDMETAVVCDAGSMLDADIAAHDVPVAATRTVMSSEG